MKVKILQGAECNVDVTHGDSVETLKVRFCKILMGLSEENLAAGAGQSSAEHQPGRPKIDAERQKAARGNTSGRLQPAGGRQAAPCGKHNQSTHLPTLLDQVRKEATPDLQASAKEGPAPAPTTGCIETQVEKFPSFYLACLTNDLSDGALSEGGA